MARLISTFRFTDESFNFNFMLKRTANTVFEDDADRMIAGREYPDVLSYLWFGNKHALVTSFAGPNLKVDGPDAGKMLAGGTVTGIFDFRSRPGGDELRTSLTEISVNAKALDAAIGTKGRADDFNLFRKMFSGDDLVRLSRNDDAIRSYGGDDRIFLGKGNDWAAGGSGDDILRGQQGRDWLVGGEGDDRFIGGVGGDVMVDGDGKDTEADLFEFHKVADGGVNRKRDVIRGFDTGNDKIDLSRIDADPGKAGDQAFAFSTTGAAANSVWVETRGKVHLVSVDADGDAVADMEILMLKSNAPGASDFIL